eukprot:4118975-Prymnesium_polylepis.1
MHPIIPHDCVDLFMRHAPIGGTFGISVESDRHVAEEELLPKLYFYVTVVEHVCTAQKPSAHIRGPRNHIVVNCGKHVANRAVAMQHDACDAASLCSEAADSAQKQRRNMNLFRLG